MTDNSPMRTPGEVLASARQKSGLSLEELATRTKIQQDMLQAIERDEYHKISGDLYVKSFMASFAKEVGVEPDLVVNMYRDFSGEVADSNSRESTDQWDEETVEVSSLGFPWVKLVVIVVVVGALALALFTFVFNGSDETEPDVKDDIVVAVETVVPVPEEIPLASSAITVTDTVSAEVPVRTDKPDTLAFGWQSSPEVKVEVIPEKKHEIEQVVPAITSVEDSASRILANIGRGHLPSVFPGDEHVLFQGKRKKSVVLRLVCPEPIEVRIKRDAESKFSTIDWPSGNDDADPLPSKNLIPGHAYAVRQGLAVYWGADDHFSLILPSIENVEITVNGVGRDLSRVKPGQEMIIDAPVKNAGR